MAKDQKEAVRLLEEFEEKYPDSDYLDVVLLGAWMAYGATLNDTQGQLRVAEKMVESPVAAMTRVAGFVTLCSILSPYVHSDDPQMEKKLADLDRWVRCGREAMAVEVRPPNLPQQNFDKSRTLSEFALERTAGYVAMLRLDYGLAASKLQAAIKLNPQDTLAYLWLSHAKLLASSPDLDSGVFYLARATELSGSPSSAAFGSVPQKQMDDYLKRVYMLVHGSDKGLENLKTLAKSSTSPPLGFSVVRQPREKHHYGTTITAVAVVALLASAAIKYPWIGHGIAGSFGGAPSKFMVFGGPGHRVYLGCLSCSDVERDSVFNPIGSHGSKVSGESIWNVVSEYGSHVSPYSACNPLASDPPVIVDQDGKAYGRLTMNRANPYVGLGARFYNWLASEVCQN